MASEDGNTSKEPRNFEEFGGLDVFQDAFQTKPSNYNRCFKQLAERINFNNLPSVTIGLTPGRASTVKSMLDQIGVLKLQDIVMLDELFPAQFSHVETN